MPKNDTRMAAEHGLLISQTRLNRVVKVDCNINQPKWALSELEWNSHAEFEAVLHITQLATTESQYEDCFLVHILQ